MAKTQEELVAIKAELSGKYKPLYTIVIPADEDNEGDTRTIFLKKFDRVCLSATQKAIGSSDALRATEIFLKNTWVGGDDLTEIIGNLDMLRSTEGTVVEMLEVKKSKLSKN